ncbi:hypothetical protein ABZX51_007860 [Aspergillus tubingensis]
MTHTTTAFRHVSQYEHRDPSSSDMIGAAAEWPQRKRQGVPERGDLAPPEAIIQTAPQGDCPVALACCCAGSEGHSLAQL